MYLRYYFYLKFPRCIYCGFICQYAHGSIIELFPYHLLTLYIPRISLHTPTAVHQWQLLVVLVVSELEWSQLLFISDWQRELVRVLASLVCLLIHNSLGLCTNYPTLPTKLCITCPVTWHVTMTVMWSLMWPCHALRHMVWQSFPRYK